MNQLTVSDERMTWKNRYKMMVGSFRDFKYENISHSFFSHLFFLVHFSHSFFQNSARRLTAEETKQLEDVGHEVIKLVVCGRGQSLNSR